MLINQKYLSQMQGNKHSTLKHAAPLFRRILRPHTCYSRSTLTVHRHPDDVLFFTANYRRDRKQTALELKRSGRFKTVLHLTVKLKD